MARRLPIGWNGQADYRAGLGVDVAAHKSAFCFAVFCFSAPEDAEAFAKRFGGECLPDHG
jgi:hypothetical protein